MAIHIKHAPFKKGDWVYDATRPDHLSVHIITYVAPRAADLVCVATGSLSAAECADAIANWLGK